MQKARTKAEVYNDLDEEVVNVFRVVRDKSSARELQRLLRLTPFARAEFQEAYNPSEDPIERARRTIVRSFMGFSSAAHNPAHRTGFRPKSFHSNVSPAKDWSNYPDCLEWFITRLQGVAIENRPALKLIPKHDGRNVLFYVDPPYPLATRYGEQCYAWEMSEEEHEDLARVLHNCRGKVVLSGYDCDLFSELYSSWKKIQRRWSAGSNRGAADRTECLWLSPRACNQKQRLQLPLAS
jgi:DNA adenine methylase